MLLYIKFLRYAALHGSCSRTLHVLINIWRLKRATNEPAKLLYIEPNEENGLSKLRLFLLRLVLLLGWTVSRLILRFLSKVQDLREMKNGHHARYICRYVLLLHCSQLRGNRMIYAIGGLRRQLADRLHRVHHLVLLHRNRSCNKGLIKICY